MYKRASLITSIFAATALFSVGALAQGDMPSFDELDEDGDGEVTQEEAQGSKLEDKFDEIDQDGDGRISQQEFDDHKQQQQSR